MLIAASIYLLGFLFAIFLHFDNQRYQEIRIDELAANLRQTSLASSAFVSKPESKTVNLTIIEAVFKALLWPIHFLIFLLSEWVKSMIAVLVN